MVAVALRLYMCARNDVLRNNLLLCLSALITFTQLGPLCTYVRMSLKFTKQDASTLLETPFLYPAASDAIRQLITRASMKDSFHTQKYVAKRCVSGTAFQAFEASGYACG